MVTSWSLSGFGIITEMEIAKSFLKSCRLFVCHQMETRAVAQLGLPRGPSWNVNVGLAFMCSRRRQRRRGEGEASPDEESWHLKFS